MIGPRPATGYTVIVCDTCADGERVLSTLREVVRRSGHGVLMRVPCPLGMVLCHARRTSGNPGSVLVVQQCDDARRPLGAAVLVGPLRTPEDLAAVADWLAVTPYDETALPLRLRGIPHPGRQSIWN
ncbi:MAG TPA: hypothetical protein VF330_04125 [Lentzea sp.]